MARPKVKIDWKKVDRLLNASCTGTGIAGLLGISADTLYRACERDNKLGFDAYRQQKIAEGDEMLIAKQYGEAMNGNPTMLVWLGKVRLGQREIKNIEVSGSVPVSFYNGKPIDKMTDEEVQKAVAELD